MAEGMLSVDTWCINGCSGKEGQDDGFWDAAAAAKDDGHLYGLEWEMAALSTSLTEIKNHHDFLDDALPDSHDASTSLDRSPVSVEQVEE